MVISCCPNGQGGLGGGHTHNDKLSFELCVDGEDIILDPGTYVYTASPEWRNRFRSTAYHNTVMVAGEEQNPFKSVELFAIHPCAVCKLHTFLCTPDRDFLEAEHTGYQRLQPSVTHRRKISYEKAERIWSITDIVMGSGYSSITAMFHLAEKLAPKIIAPNCFVVTSRKGNHVSFLLSVPGEAAVHLEIADGWISPGYGDKRKSAVVQCRILGALPLEFSVEISYTGQLLARQAKGETGQGKKSNPIVGGDNNIK